MEKIEFKLEGLTCDACVRLSKMKLEKVPGVENVQVSGLDGRAEISANRKITLEEIQNALSGTDYKVTN